VKKSSAVVNRVGEGLAILVSILLAFGIDAAWENREERAEELRILSSLRNEFGVNQSRVAENIAFHSTLRSTGIAILEAARGTAADLDGNVLDEMIVDLTWWGGLLVFESASLDAVILGGRLDLIQNEELRRLLTGWRSAVEQTARQEAEEFVHYSDVWMPLLRRRANVAQIGNAATKVPGSTEPFVTEPVPVPLAERDHRPLLNDAEFLNAVVQKIWIEDIVLQQYRILEDRVEELVAVLDGDIAGRAAAP
jgi:hypothetical protein